MPKMKLELYQRNILKNGRYTSLRLNKVRMVQLGTTCVEIMIALIWFHGRQKTTSTKILERARKLWMMVKVSTAGKCQSRLVTINSSLSIHGKMTRSL